MLNSLVKSISPNFPSDRAVKSSHDESLWFTVPAGTKTLYVPPIKLLRTSMTHLNKFIESVSAFEHRNFSNEFLYSWDNLNTKTFRGDECLKGIRELKGCKIVACDIETKDTTWEGNALLAIGIAVSEDTSYAFHDIPEKLYPAFDTFFSQDDVEFIWQNGKFDCGRLKYLCNINAHVSQDVMLMHYVGINETKGTHGLKDMGSIYLGAPKWEDELQKYKRTYCREHKIKISDFTYDMFPPEVLIPYLHYDCVATFRLYQVFKKLMRPDANFIYGKLIEASNAYMEVELNGMRIDTEYLEDLEYSMETQLDKATRALAEVASRVWDPVKYSKDTGAKSAKPDSKFNVKSPKQLKWMLETLVGYPLPSTDAATIEGLLNDVQKGIITDKNAVEFLNVIGDVRKLSKYMDTYIQGFRESLCKDMRIRGTFNLHGTETGRLSSSNPNMQNIPRDKTIKNLIACAPGYRLVQLDYSQAELRVLALLSGDPWLTAVYQDDKDLHDAVALDMFGEGFDKEQRVMAKTINFGIAYGRGPGSIAQTFGKTVAEARGIINKWYRPMPKVKEYIENRRRMATAGEKCSTIFGRERHFIVMNDNINHIQNDYINTPIQSVASDLTMFSLISIDNYRKESKLDFKIVASVHDSIVLEVKDDPEVLRKVAQKCKEIMQDTPAQFIENLQVPFKADAESGYAYGSLEAMEL